MKINIQTLDAKASGELELNESIFGLEPRVDILHRMVRYQLARRQAGTHKVQERGDVKKTTKRIGRQKGGGTARHGNGSVSQFRGGGKAHGPRVRSHAHDLPKKVRAAALRHALSAKVKAGELVIITEANLKTMRTQALRAQLNKLDLHNVLFIDGAVVNENFAKAASNLVNVDVLPSQGANVYDILRRHTLVLTKQAVVDLEMRLACQ